jgi:hypothetical protein
MMTIFNGVTYAFGYACLCVCVGVILALLRLWWLEEPRVCQHCQDPLRRFTRAKLCPACLAGYRTGRDEFNRWLASWEDAIAATREQIRRERQC